MTSLNSVFANKLASMSALFTEMGYDAISANGIVQGKLYGMLIQQSTLCAFINAYRIYAVLVLILVPLVLLLKRFEFNENNYS